MPRKKGARVPESIKQAAWTSFSEGLSKSWISKHYGIARGTVNNLIENMINRGTFENPSTGSKTGPKYVIHAALQDVVENRLQEKKTMYQHELAQFLQTEHGVKASQPTISRALKRIKLTNKNCSRVASQQSQLLRDVYAAEIGQYSPEQLCFADETAVCENTTRRKRGWATKGVKVRVRSLFSRTRRFSFLPLLGINGYLSSQCVHDSFSEYSFSNWVKDVAMPAMNAYPLPYSVLVVDNATIHNSEEIQAICTTKGVRLVFLPPYSPDLNPIENTFGLLKRYLRREYEDTSTAQLEEAIMEASRLCLTPEIVEALYRGAGYFYVDNEAREAAERNWEALAVLRIE